MNFLPIFMNIKAQPCLVVGGGDVASRKVFLLLRAGGEVTVVSPELCDELQRWQQAGDIKYTNGALNQPISRAGKLLLRQPTMRK